VTGGVLLSTPATLLLLLLLLPSSHAQDPPAMDIESLERANERQIDTLSERLGLLKQVGQTRQGGRPCFGAPPHAAWLVLAPARILSCRPPTPFAQRWTRSTTCSTAW
jgi:hypothetical protein